MEQLSTRDGGVMYYGWRCGHCGVQLQELVAWTENAASERFVAERARVPVITELEPWLV